MERPVIKRSICLLVVMTCGVMHANAKQGCPYASSVQLKEGRFQVRDGQLLWQSPKVKQLDFVSGFVGALFIPAQGQARENGYVEKCIYRTNSDQVIALRYGGSEDVDSVSLTSSLHWRLAKDPLDQDVYICDDSQPDNCSFTIDRSKR